MLDLFIVYIVTLSLYAGITVLIRFHFMEQVRTLLYQEYEPDCSIAPVEWISEGDLFVISLLLGVFVYAPISSIISVAMEDYFMKFFAIVPFAYQINMMYCKFKEIPNLSICRLNDEGLFRKDSDGTNKSLVFRYKDLLWITYEKSGFSYNIDASAVSEGERSMCISDSIHCGSATDEVHAFLRARVVPSGETVEEIG